MTSNSKILLKVFFVVIIRILIQVLEWTQQEEKEKNNLYLEIPIPETAPLGILQLKVFFQCSSQAENNFFPPQREECTDSCAEVVCTDEE